MPPTTLITCHANADFDALAALVAASKLHPGSLLLFPGTQEEALKSFYQETASAMFNFVRANEVPWEAVTHLVAVDTRQRGRLQHVAPLFAPEHAPVRVEIWDHHPATEDDLPADELHSEEWGACTTLILQEIQARNIPVDSNEATIFGAGIYADTGTFTFSSTTPEDLRAAAWLLERGMDVNTISDLSTHELTKEQVQALHSLLESSTPHYIGNICVHVAEARLDEYLGEFALVAHKLMQMEQIDVLFALASMGDQVLVVARSRMAEVDVGKVCKALGGGGHAYAASANLRDKTLHQVRDEIRRLVYAQAHGDKCAEDYMSTPPVGVEAQHTIKHADEVMRGFGLKAVPVFQQGSKRLVGLLDSQTAARAVSHGLENLPVEIYMQRHVHSLPPDATLDKVTSIIVGERQRLVPIVQHDAVVGVITRTDLINLFVNDPTGLPPLRDTRKERNVAKLMRDRLTRDCNALLAQAGELGDSMGMQVYAVGGFVRDMLLNVHNQDIDLVVEGNGLAFARALADKLGGRVREHQEFLTAVVIFEDRPGHSRRIDVATARLEYYESPAALPTVEVSSIKMDLSRRDFSINALAIRLGKAVYGQLVDFFGSQHDIRDRIIRVLHSLSFVEDPTRCLRAVRFAERYNFRLGTGTERLIKNALGLKLMDKLSGARLFHEFCLICEEANPTAAFTHLDKLGILGAIHPSLALVTPRMELMHKVKDVLDWYRLLYYEEKCAQWYLYLLALCRGMNYPEASGIFERLGLPSTQKGDILQRRERIRAARHRLQYWQKKQGRISELCEILDALSLEGALFLMAYCDDESLRMNLSRYITTWRRDKVDITGEDLMAMGLPPGPLFGRILRRVLAAKRDGNAPTRESQKFLARTLAHQAEFDE